MGHTWRRLVFCAFWWFWTLGIWAENVRPSGVTISRHFQGDMFFGSDEECAASYCTSQNRSAHPVRRGSCQCQCDASTAIYRDDVGSCVSTIEECVLADYVNGATYEKVPFVFMPLKGQLINPSAEIALSDVRAEGQTVVSPVCVVSKANYLTTSGWVIADNTSSLEPPFALYREADKTFLQWLGDPRQRALLEGRIVLVRLLCKDTANPRVGVFSPCIAFRVAGSPGLAESSFLGEAKKVEGGLQPNDYIAIGISVGLLTVLYILGIALCLIYRKRQRSLAQHKKLLHPGSPLLEEGRVRVNPLLQNPDNLMSQALRASIRQQQQQQHMGATLLPPPNSNLRNGQHPAVDARASTDAPVVDGNMFPSRRQMTTAIVHPMEHNNHTNAQGTPPEPLVATVSAPKVNMTEEEKRLYFSGTYLDPQLLKQAPPPVTLEFLSRIRGMIDIARTKIATKRFLPSLIDIPEEYQYGTLQAQRLAQQNATYGQVAPSSKLSQIDEDTEENVSQKSESKYSVRSTSSSVQKRSANDVYDSLKRGVTSTFNQVMKRTRSPAKSESTESLHKAEAITVKPLERIPALVEHKSPLPSRQSNSTGNASNIEDFDTVDSPEKVGEDPGYAKITAPAFSMYTNPSINDIYGSLAKSKPTKPANSLTSEDDKDSDVLSDILSEAESKVPKIDSDTGSSQSTLKTSPKVPYFEADSLERIYESRKRRKDSVDDEVDQESVKTQKNSIEDEKNPVGSSGTGKEEKKEPLEYDSATSTSKSVKSLSQLCPGGEKIEASNALFNMQTGHNTIHRAFRKNTPKVSVHKLKSLENVNRWNNDHIYEYIDERISGRTTAAKEVEDDQSVMSLSSTRAMPGSPASQKSSTSSTTSILTVLPGSSEGSNRKSKTKLSPTTSLDVQCDDFSDSCSTLTRITVGEYEEVHPGKLTIEVDDGQNSQAIPINEEDNFEPDTLEKRPRGGVNKKRLLRHESFMDSLERPKVKTPLKQTNSPNESPLSPASSSGVESSESLCPSVPPVPPSLSMLRELRGLDQISSRQNVSNARSSNETASDQGSLTKPNKTQQYPTKVPTIYDPAIPPPRPPKSEKVLASQLLESRPSLPPKSRKEVAPQPCPAALESINAGSVQKTIEIFSEEPRKRVYNGQFILSTKEEELESPPGRRLSVLERIAALEREETKIREEACLENSQGMTKGMEIALTLRARLGKDLEGTLKDRDRTRTIKKTWRRFLEKVEDSFSETDAPSSTNSSLVGTLRQIKSRKKRGSYPTVEDYPQDDEQDSSPTSVRSWKPNRPKKVLEESKSTSSQTISVSSSSSSGSNSEQSVSDGSMTITSTLPTEFDDQDHDDLKVDESDSESGTSLGSDGGASCSTVNSSMILDRNSSMPSKGFRGIMHLNHQLGSGVNAKNTSQITLLAMKRLEENNSQKKHISNDSFDSGLYSGAYSERVNTASLF